MDHALDQAQRHSQLLDAAMATLVRSLPRYADEVLWLCDRTAISGRGRPGRWVNQCVGLGLNGPVTDADVEGVAAFQEAVGAEPRIDLIDAADPSAFRSCQAAGFKLVNVETICVADFERTKPTAASSEIAVSECAFETNEPAVADFVRLMEGGFNDNADFEPEPVETADWSRDLQTPRTRCFIARVGEEMAGAGSYGVADGLTPSVGMLFGGSTLPAYRRRGIQGALLRARLSAASEEGLDACIVIGRSGGPTVRNALRHGMTPLCSTMTFTRPGAGLKSSM